MFQRGVIGQFLQDSFIERQLLPSKTLETNNSIPTNRVHTLISLLLQKSRDDVLNYLDKEYEDNNFSRIHPLDIILFFIQQSPDDYQNLIFNALSDMNFAIPLVINDNIYPENAKRQEHLRNDEIKST